MYTLIILIYLYSIIFDFKVLAARYPLLYQKHLVMVRSSLSALTSFTNVTPDS